MLPYQPDLRHTVLVMVSAVKSDTVGDASTISVIINASLRRVLPDLYTVIVHVGHIACSIPGKGVGAAFDDDGLDTYRGRPG